jgi:hypothetical protein
MRRRRTSGHGTPMRAITAWVACVSSAATSSPLNAVVVLWECAKLFDQEVSSVGPAVGPLNFKIAFWSKTAHDGGCGWERTRVTGRVIGRTTSPPRENEMSFGLQSAVPSPRRHCWQ